MIATEGTERKILGGAPSLPGHCYVNGELAASYQYDPVKNPDSWEQPLELPLGPAFRAGEPNTIAIRVHDSEGAGGIWRGAFLVFREPR